ncbi:MAG: NAD(P)-dependent alcohol dehydrogenase [Pseudomonadota bacterium]
MKSIQIKQPGGLDNLQVVDIDAPQPGAGEVAVRWHASSLNFHDYLVANGSIPVADGQIPMSDGAGEIAAVGAGVSNWQEGDKVMSLFFPNWLAGTPSFAATKTISGETAPGFATEMSCVNAQSLTRMPNGYSYAEAATLPCAALTAWRALVVEGNLKTGDRVLTEGSGGMSIFGLQIAKAAGAYVYATTSSDEKAQRLLALGADHVLNYREDERWGKTVFKHSGGGVEHVLDVGGGTTLAQSVEAVGFGGNVTLIGILGGRKGEFVLPKLFFKHATMTGIAVANRTAQEEMVRALEISDYKPVIDKSFALEDIADAFRYQESGQHFGKIVLEY